MHRVRTLLLATGLLAAASCAAPKATPVGGSFSSEALAAAQPADVAVLPVRDLSEQGGAPTDELRASLVTGLVERFYSPLALDYVDRTWAEASTGGVDPAADALLQVVVTDWDATHLTTRGVVYATAEALLLPGDDPEGTPLWGVTLTERMRVAEPDGSVRPEEPPWPVKAARMLGAAILRDLPERDPVAAAR